MHLAILLCLLFFVEQELNSIIVEEGNCDDVIFLGENLNSMHARYMEVALYKFTGTFFKFIISLHSCFQFADLRHFLGTSHKNLLESVHFYKIYIEQPRVLLCTRGGYINLWIAKPTRVPEVDNKQNWAT